MDRCCCRRCWYCWWAGKVTFVVCWEVKWAKREIPCCYHFNNHSSISLNRSWRFPLSLEDTTDCICSFVMLVVYNHKTGFWGGSWSWNTNWVREPAKRELFARFIIRDVINGNGMHKHVIREQKPFALIIASSRITREPKLTKLYFAAKKRKKNFRF